MVILHHRLLGPLANISMRIFPLLIMALLSSHLLFGSNYSKSFYVLNGTDTIYVSGPEEILNCNHILVTEKSHNLCQIMVGGSPYSGKIHYEICRLDTTLEVFDGNVVDGFIHDGTMMEYSKTSQLIKSGQFLDNWKYGIWTTYYDNGQIQSVMKFIKFADWPVLEWDFSKEGRLIYQSNEQIQIEGRIRDAQE